MGRNKMFSLLFAVRKELHGGVLYLGFSVVDVQIVWVLGFHLRPPPFTLINMLKIQGSPGSCGVSLLQGQFIDLCNKLCSTLFSFIDSEENHYYDDSYEEDREIIVVEVIENSKSFVFFHHGGLPEEDYHVLYIRTTKEEKMYVVSKKECTSWEILAEIPIRATSYCQVTYEDLNSHHRQLLDRFRRNMPCVFDGMGIVNISNINTLDVSSALQRWAAGFGCFVLPLEYILEFVYNGSKVSTVSWDRMVFVFAHRDLCTMSIEFRSDVSQQRIECVDSSQRVFSYTCTTTMCRHAVTCETSKVFYVVLIWEKLPQPDFQHVNGTFTLGPNSVSPPLSFPWYQLCFSTANNISLGAVFTRLGSCYKFTSFLCWSVVSFPSRKLLTCGKLSFLLACFSNKLRFMLGKQNTNAVVVVLMWTLLTYSLDMHATFYSHTMITTRTLGNILGCMVGDSLQVWVGRYIFDFFAEFQDFQLQAELHLKYCAVPIRSCDLVFKTCDFVWLVFREDRLCSHEYQQGLTLAPKKDKRIKEKEDLVVTRVQGSLVATFVFTAAHQEGKFRKLHFRHKKKRHEVRKREYYELVDKGYLQRFKIRGRLFLTGGTDAAHLQVIDHHLNDFVDCLSHVNGPEVHGF